MTDRRDRLRRGLPCIGPARSLGRHADGGWWSFRSDAPASTESGWPSRHREYASMRTSRASDPRWDRRWRSLTRCLPVSCVHVALRSGTRCVLHASRTRVLDHRRKPMTGPSLRIARGDARTVLFREQRGDRPERTKSYRERRAQRPPARSERRSDQERARNSHTSFATTLFVPLHSVPSRAPSTAAVASELRCTHGLGAHPRPAKGMFRRLQQSTISIFKDEHPRPASQSDDARAVRSCAGRRKPPFTTRLPLRCVDPIAAGSWPGESPSTAPLISRHISSSGG
jgi:hypothetical protein